MKHMMRESRLALCGDQEDEEVLTDKLAEVSCPACVCVLSIIAEAVERGVEPKLIWVQAFLHHTETCSVCVKNTHHQHKITGGRPIQAVYLSRTCRHAHALYAQLTAEMDHEVEGIISA